MQWASPSHWLGRRVLVTGASGFLGRGVCARLLEAGAEVHALSHRRPVPPGTTGWPAVLPRDADAAIGDLKPQVVMHLASPVDLSRAPETFLRLRAGILDASDAVARACATHGARLLHVGTCDEYGDAPAPLAEDTLGSPVSAYGALKLAATHWVLTLVRTAGLSATVVRPFRTYGPHDRSSVIALSCRAALAARPLDLTDGAQIREWNHIDAMAMGLVAAAAHPDAPGRVLNLGGGARASVRSVVEQIFDLAAADPELTRFGALPRRPGEPSAFFGDHSAADALLGPLPHPTLTDGLEDTLEWHRHAADADPAR